MNVTHKKLTALTNKSDEIAALRKGSKINV